jgi:hypothetical protein
MIGLWHFATPVKSSKLVTVEIPHSPGGMRCIRATTLGCPRIAAMQVLVSSKYRIAPI